MPALAPRRTRSGPGFTLLELIVTVSILAVLTAVIVPLYGSAVTALQRRGAQGDLVARLLYAQELAVREGREIRVYLDGRAQAYWLEGWAGGDGDDKRFEPLADPAAGGVHTLPPGMRIARLDARTDRARRMPYVACLPNGACDRVRIRLARGDEPGATITTTGILGGVEVTP